MSWHYQIRHCTIDGADWYDIVEAYNDSTSWTQDGMAPGGEMATGVIETLERMLADAKKYPVLEDMK